MPLDGIVLSNIAKEIEDTALGLRIDKIHQPERDEVVLLLRSHRLLLSANPTSPKVCFADTAGENPMQAPLFCMVLRKHLAGGKIVRINQPGFERILEVSIESINEMGDLSKKQLIIEIMGKHSNIILVDEKGVIIDSVKRVSLDKSSVRQVLPGMAYVYPPGQDKLDPRSTVKEDFLAKIGTLTAMKAGEAIYKSYSGISPLAASEICIRGNINPSDFVGTVDLGVLYEAFNKIFADIKNHIYYPKIYMEDGGKIKDFSSIDLKMWHGLENTGYNSISKLINDFYRQKDAYYKRSQKTQDLKKLVANHVERLSKKKEVLLNTLEEIKNRDEIKRKGELITANIYAIKQGQTTVSLINFYEDEAPLVEIALDAAKTPAENAQSYFKKYNKQKRTFEAANEQLIVADEDLYYLESILNGLNTNLLAQDIEDIRQELREQGFIKKNPAPLKKPKQQAKKSAPMRFKSSDGFEIYVGKSNKQNDELTMEFAQGSDLWLHTKNIPGSHVIVRTEGAALPDKTIEEAAHLAAYFSKGRGANLVPVDYTNRKNVKKPGGAKPGMVIYNTYNTAYITPDIAVIDRINEYNEVY
ncbi:MAG: NFACT family protein [Defluviitaleaceae bacterium]|nr:NFACT family protein [Defluviitaleaceae bacterium]